MLRRFSAALALTPLLFHTPLLIAAESDPDPGFGTGGAAFLQLDPEEGHHLVPFAALSLPNGKLLFAGYRNKIIFPSPDPHYLPFLARMNADGSPDTTFGGDPANPGVLVLRNLPDDTGIRQIEAMARTAQGSIVLAGSTTAFGPTRGFLMQVDAAGELDQGFGDRGIVLVPGAQFHALKLDSQQRIVVGGEVVGGTPLYRGVVWRFTAAGAPDTGFAGDGNIELVEPGVDQMGYVTDIALTADDRVVAVGSYQTPDPLFFDNYDFSVARIASDGTLDDGFAGDGWAAFDMPTLPSYFDGVDRVLVAADGSITLAGHYNAANDEIELVLAKLDATGAPVATYGNPATPGFQTLDAAPTAGTQYVTAMLPQHDGRVLLSVTAFIPGDDADFRLLRVDAAGHADVSFGTGGIATHDFAHGGNFDEARVLTMHQGRPLVAGVAMAAPETRRYDLAVLRLEGLGVVFADGFEQ